MKFREITENRRLSLLTFITAFGDFVSLFAVMKLVNGITGKVEVAAYLVAFRSLSVLVAGLIFPRLAGKFSTRSLIVFSQLLCGFLMAAVCVIATNPTGKVPLLFFLLLMQSTLKQIFENARETHSKRTAQSKEHRTLQAEILHGFYGAQTIGPIASYYLIQSVSISAVLVVDVISFFFVAVMALGLHKEFVPVKQRTLAPFLYMHKTRGLWLIFMLRAVAYWIPVGIFNYMLFGVVTHHYGLELESSAWIYAAIGLGSSVASLVLMNPVSTKRTWIGKLQDNQIAFVALSVLALTRIAFIGLPNFGAAIFILVISGICNGLNAITTQSIRRRLTSDQQFPEVVGLEQVVGRGADFVVQTACLVLLSSNYLTFSEGIWISSISLFLFALIHLAPSLREPQVI